MLENSLLLGGNFWRNNKLDFFRSAIGGWFKSKIRQSIDIIIITSAVSAVTAVVVRRWRRGFCYSLCLRSLSSFLLIVCRLTVGSRRERSSCSTTGRSVKRIPSTFSRSEVQRQCLTHGHVIATALRHSLSEGRSVPWLKIQPIDLHTATFTASSVVWIFS